ncbi:DMT family transporter [Paraburkholderia sp. CNPSo 3281]|uniref:DMT family transporter n=1 Tax=Paraburkholderia sp. CNPSo 3281 TaxID=2940933 RepID=UPI0020B8F612|nr:DMT family transporter [Paraburkholderia sp. CNPSo 3281]MCP3717386.1 DMT family transporter [Paraburkholderia sp. CNPSo 3281]
MSTTNPSPAVAATPSQPSAWGSYTRGVLFCVAATLSFGIMFPVMTDALLHIDPFTFTSLRYLIAGTAFLILLVAREGFGTLRLKGERIGFAWFLGSIGFAGFGFFVFLGQQLAGRDGALTASIMMATQPMIGLLLNSAVRRIRPPLFSFLFIVMSFCGVALVVTKGDIVGLLNEPQNYAANALIVLGAACWVVYTFSAMYFPTWSAFKYTTVTTWLGLSTIVAVNLVLFATHAIPVPHLSTLSAIGPHLLYMGLVAGFGGILCWNLGNKILTPLNGVLFMDVVPITTFIVSSLEGVIPTNVQIAGACMSGAALILNNAYLRVRARRQAAAK